MLNHTSPALNRAEIGASSAQLAKKIYGMAGKRFLDVIFSIFAILLVWPLVLLAVAVIALDGHSPFFLQQRVGRNGRIFTIFKLRSMVVNAEERLSAHLAKNPEARVEWEKTQKLQDDPRITAVGRLVRKTSIDELPQFLNVLLGDMSIVGPRPILPEQKSIYPGTAYYSMRPGITGPWQIGGRNMTPFTDRAKYDEAYNDNISFLNDTRIVLKTLDVVAKGTGV
ncbi:sugar transferase [Amaricoccus tamworthensis]|uniref:sugar transferase n=1 Tax=Amaricoccus tamworthensis TaxID=57002 RepID=UPI003C7B9CD3